MKKMTITMVHSDLISEMLFENEKDAKEFDDTLTEYINTPEAIEEFKAPAYASIEAVRRAILDDRFHFHLAGPYSDGLLAAAENMVDGCNGATADDCYKLPLMYIFAKVYGKH